MSKNLRVNISYENKGTNDGEYNAFMKFFYGNNLYAITLTQ